MFHIDLQNDLQYPVSASRLEEAAQAALSRWREEGALSIVITDDDTIMTLNQQYRGINTPTDVLSFPADAPPVTLPGEPVYLGDVLIAFPYAADQAAREGHPLDDSLALLVVHGTLHLLGYDHNTPQNRAVMWAAQDEVLRMLHIATDLVPTLESYPGHDTETD